MAQSWEFKQVVWWLVHRVYNNSRNHYYNDFNSSLESFVDVVVVDLPLLRVAVEGSDNPISLEKP